MSVFLQPLQTVTVGAGGVATISFASIPQGYTDLVVKCSLAASGAATSVNGTMYLNGNNSNGSFTNLFGNGSGASSSRVSGYMDVVTTPGSTSTANTFSSNEIYFANYTSSNYKSIISDSVNENNTAAADQVLRSILWSNTAAINQIQITCTNGSWVQYSKVSLYGVLRNGI